MSIDHKCEVKVEGIERFFYGIGIPKQTAEIYLRNYHTYLEKVKKEHLCSQQNFELFVYEVLKG